MDKATRERLRAQASHTPIGNTQTIVTVPTPKSITSISSAPQPIQPEAKPKKEKQAFHGGTSVSARETQHKIKGRLPDGATFHAVYDATTQKWTGTLEIPGAPIFGEKANGVFWCMSNLDNKYREFLANA